MAKGKREFLFEIGSLQTDITELRRIVEKSLKVQGVKASEDIKMYFNTKEGIVYCVTPSNVYKVSLCLNN